MNANESGRFVLLLAGACISSLLAVSCKSTNEGRPHGTLASPTTAIPEQPSQTVAEESRKANKWISNPPANSKAWAADALGNSRWRIVPDSKDPLAESMLQTSPFVGLTESKAFELAGEFSPQGKIAKPFLIRAVGSQMGTSGFEIYVEKNGDVTVIGGALSHHDVPSERRPIVVWLDQPLRRLYISFEVGVRFRRPIGG
jgi:hypothetical protein